MLSSTSALCLSMEELMFLLDAALCLCYVLPKFTSATNTQLSSKEKMSSVGQLCMKTSNAAGRELGSQISNCNVT